MLAAATSRRTVGPELSASSRSRAGPLQWRVFFETTAARDGAAARCAKGRPTSDLESAEVRGRRLGGAIAARARAPSARAHLSSRRRGTSPRIASCDDRDRDRAVARFWYGSHASTRLCLRALSDIDVRASRVLDLGTGSGVLAMAAAIKGGREVVAVDIDADAIDAAQESAALNTLPVAIRMGRWRLP